MKTQLIAFLLLTLSACGQTESRKENVSNKTQFDKIQKQPTSMSDYLPSRDNAHPNAKKLMADDFYFDIMLPSAPFGSDEGADSHAGFKEWRQSHKTDSPKDFLNEQISGWGYPPFDYNETTFEKLKPYLKSNQIGFRLLTGSDAAIISIAFTQLYLEGTIDNEFKELAKKTIKRELLPEVMLLWGNPYGIEDIKLTDPEIVQREKDLKKMLEVLNKVE